MLTRARPYGVESWFQLIQVRAAKVGITEVKKIGMGVMGVTFGVISLASCSSDVPKKGPSPTAAYKLADGTYAGPVVKHKHGPIQVQITVVDAQIANVVVLQSPRETPRSVEINQDALPQLNDAVLAQQSTYIDFVSGATLTSKAYVESLQGAIDQANQA
jgi:uncharacterized protein with FMN-binding domain